MLCDDHDCCRGVARDVAGEDGSIDHEEIVGSVDLGVGVDHRLASGASVVGAHAYGTWRDVSMFLVISWRSCEERRELTDPVVGVS